MIFVFGNLFTIEGTRVIDVPCGVARKMQSISVGRFSMSGSINFFSVIPFKNL